MAVTEKSKKLASPKARCYWISIQRDGQYFANERFMITSLEGVLPSEWFETVAQADVVRANISTSVEIRKRSDRRKYLATYVRG